MSATPPQTGLARQYAKTKFGDQVEVDKNPVTTTVGTGQTLIAPNNPERIALVIVNRDVNPIGLDFYPGVTLTNALTLAGGGAMLVLTADDDGELVTFPVFAISAAGGATVYVLEVGR